MPDAQLDVQSNTNTFGSMIARLAALIANENFSNSDRAALKRMNLEREPPLAFYRFAIRQLPDRWQHDVRTWQALLQGMALMSPRIHDPTIAFGRALAENRYHEARLERLLAAQDNTKLILLLRATRFLAAKKIACDWRDIARVLLTVDREKRESLQMKIATDYYRNQPRDIQE